MSTLGEPDTRARERILACADDLMTLAPCLDRSRSFIRLLARAGLLCGEALLALEAEFAATLDCVIDIAVDEAVNTVHLGLGRAIAAAQNGDESLAIAEAIGIAEGLDQALGRYPSAGGHLAAGARQR